MSGVTVARRLLDAPDSPQRRIVLIEPGHPGRGIAYGTDLDAHLLNVPAGRMSAIPGHPGHFLEWLRPRAGDATGGSFVPRRWYGGYLESLVTEAAESGRLKILTDRVTGISTGDTGMTLALASGGILGADRVVLATGLLPPYLPPGVGPEVASDPRFIRDPWLPGWSRLVPREAPVLFLGSGLTMIDAVLELRAAGHSGPLRAVSRRGLLPGSHRGLRQDPGRQPPPSTLASIAPTSLGYLRAIRAAVHEATELGGDWRDVVASLRPVTHHLWRRLPVRERRRFLRHLRGFWDAHRHRAAPEVALRIAVLRAKRQLVVIAGRVARIDPRDDGLMVRIRNRDGTEAHLLVALVVNCTGPDTNLTRSADPLTRSLLDSGLMRQDELRLGIETGEGGELIGRDGRPSVGLYYVGPMLRAGWWEATAVPELVEHAARTADAVLAGLT